MRSSPDDGSPDDGGPDDGGPDDGGPDDGGRHVPGGVGGDQDDRFATHKHLPQVALVPYQPAQAPPPRCNGRRAARNFGGGSSGPHSGAATAKSQPQRRAW